MKPAGATPGRPTKGGAQLSKTLILETALALLDAKGPQAISFRTLAHALGVTPMAVKYHVKSKQVMMRDLMALAFGDLNTEGDGATPQERLRNILVRYCRRARSHPNLVLATFGNPNLISGTVASLTESIRKNTRLLNDGDPEDVMLNLVIDYTHGFVLAAAAAPEDDSPDEAGFLRSLDWVLSRSGKPDCN